MPITNELWLRNLFYRIFVFLTAQTEFFDPGQKHVLRPSQKGKSRSVAIHTNMITTLIASSLGDSIQRWNAYVNVTLQNSKIRENCATSYPVACQLIHPLTGCLSTHPSGIRSEKSKYPLPSLSAAGLITSSLNLITISTSTLHTTGYTSDSVKLRRTQECAISKGKLH